MTSEKKFRLPPQGTPFSEFYKAIEDEINKLHAEIESLRSSRRRIVEPSGERCNQWCAYQGYQEHLPNCSRKGPTQ